MKLDKAIKIVTDKLESRQFGHEYVSTCPFCKSDKQKFYINADTGMYSCKRGSCMATGNMTTLAKEMGLNETIEYPEEKYNIKKKKERGNIKPERLRELRETDEDIINYMFGRGITYETMRDADVRYSEKYHAMAFLARNSEEELVAVYYRKPPKSVTMERGSDARLWGKEKLDYTNDTLYITEGHIDALTLLEIDVPNVVSIPNGASSHDWIERDWDCIHQFKKIVLCYDNDKAGNEAINKVKNRLDFANLYMLEYKNQNDINDLFMNDYEQLLKTVENPKEIPMDGFVSLKSVMTDKDPMARLTSCGIPAIDKIYGGLGNNESTIICAASGNGKTTVMANLINGFISTGSKVSVWSGELTNSTLKTWIYSVVAGEKAIQTKENKYRPGDTASFIKEEYEKKIDKIMDGKLYVYDGNKNDAFKMLDQFEMLYKKNNVDVFFIDNASILDMSVPGKEKYASEEEFAKRLAAFLRNNPVKVFLVMHPTKTSLNTDPNFTTGKGKVKRPEKYNQYQVKGSSALVNLAHNILFLNRATDHHKAWFMQQQKAKMDRDGAPNEEIEKAMKLINKELSLICYLDKNRNNGFTQEDALFGYSKETRRIYGLTNKEEDLSRGVINLDDTEVTDEDLEFEEIAEDNNKGFGLDDF